MSDALLVLNAGSSSLKFCVFRNEDPLRPLLGGAVDALHTHPRFTASDDTTVLGTHEWEEGTSLSHERAIEFLLTWAQGHNLEGHRITAVGHRVVHGGTRFTGPSRVTSQPSQNSRR